MTTRPRYRIQPETLGGVMHWMIYQKVFLLGWLFLARYNTPESAAGRLEELTHRSES